MKFWIQTTLLLSVQLCIFSVQAAELRLPGIFSDNMVLQQGQPVPVWGWAEPGQKVSLAIAGQTRETEADAAGRWQVEFAPLPSGGESLTMEISSGKTIRISNILIGEVWLCAGQSNMQWRMSGNLESDKERADADIPEIRFFEIESGPRKEPETELPGKWIVFSKASSRRCSAVAYFFGRELHRQLQMPVGLIVAAVGGTPIEAWTSLDAQRVMPEFAEIDRLYEPQRSRKWDAAAAQAGYEQALADWEGARTKARAENTQAPRRPQPPVPPDEAKQLPGILFNGFIAPLIPFAVKGAVWYQGESNAFLPHAPFYGRQLEVLVADWRSRWGYNFPFAWVQLPEFDRQHARFQAYWPLIREHMLQALETIPNSGMAIALGEGELDDVHPRQKRTVGRRLALWALKDVYGKRDIVAQGPLPAESRIKNGRMIITFSHAEGGLQLKGESVTGFELAGADRKWFAASAEIDGNRVTLSSPDVPEPAAARYAWRAAPDWSLLNEAGIPASPFRTDDWEIVPE